MSHPTLSPLAQSFFEAIRTDTLPSLGPEARNGVKSRAELLELAGAFCNANSLAETARALLQSAALLWHDDLDGSHEISQGIPTAEGSFLHGIMHRREPDNSNAKYWFRQVGDHASFPALAAAVGESEPSLAALLIPDGCWDAFAFVDACHRAIGEAESPENAALRKVQELEFRFLLGHILS